MITITVRLLAGLNRHLSEDADPPRDYSVQVAASARVGDVVSGLPFSHDRPVTCLLNGRHANDDQLLQEGDVLSIFPAVGGG